MANKVAVFSKEVRAELGKVSWSTREELITSATLVITSMLLLSLFIWICDVIFVHAVDVIIKL